MSDTSTETVIQDVPVLHASWICPTCAQENFETDDTCVVCGWLNEPADADAEAKEAIDAGVAQTPPVDAIADALAQTADQYAAAAQAERRQETDDVEGVFDGPYDPAKAMTAITRLNRECEAAEKEYLVSKEHTSGCKKTWEARQLALNTLIRQYDTRSREIQPVLKTLDEAPSEASAGRDALLQTLSFALLGKQCFLDVEDLAKLHESDRGALHEWATSKKKGPIMPLVLATAHVAGVIGADGQHCTKCGTVLEWVSADATPYVAGSLIGLNCDGEQPEAARPVKRRGSKKTKQVDPEAERVEQAKAGQAEKAKKANGDEAAIEVDA